MPRRMTFEEIADRTWPTAEGGRYDTLSIATAIALTALGAPHTPAQIKKLAGLKTGEHFTAGKTPQLEIALMNNGVNVEHVGHRKYDMAPYLAADTTKTYEDYKREMGRVGAGTGQLTRDGFERNRALFAEYDPQYRAAEARGQFRQTWSDINGKALRRAVGIGSVVAIESTRSPQNMPAFAILGPEENGVLQGVYALDGTDPRHRAQQLTPTDGWPNFISERNGLRILSLA